MGLLQLGKRMGTSWSDAVRYGPGKHKENTGAPADRFAKFDHTPERRQRELRKALSALDRERARRAHRAGG